MEIGPLRERLSKLQSRLEILRGIFDIDGKRTRIAALDEQTTAADFWNDAAGNRIWLRQFGSARGDDADDVATDAAGNIYVTGRTGGIDPPLTDDSYVGYLAKFDAAGTFAWIRQIPKDGGASEVAVDGRGDVYMAGNYLNTFDGQPNRGNTDFYVMKFSAAGVKY